MAKVNTLESSQVLVVNCLIRLPLELLPQSAKTDAGAYTPSIRSLFVPMELPSNDAYLHHHSLRTFISLTLAHLILVLLQQISSSIDPALNDSGPLL